MKILNLSLDKSILDRNSKTAKRAVEYGDLADGYIVVVPDNDYKEIRLSEKVFVYGSGGNNKIFQLINVYRVAKKLLRRREFDVITVQDQYYLALVGRILAKKFKIGLELQIHGFEKYSGLRKIIADFAIPRANAIRCVSQRLKKQLIRDFGVKEEKITVTSIYSELRIMNYELRTKKESEKFIFLTVGRLVAVKNISLQIRAMAKVVESEKFKACLAGRQVESRKIELWIVGDGPERKKLELKIKNLKLQNYIKLLGWQSNPEEFYSQADAFLLIIMTDVGCAGELVKDGESGIVIPINDQAKLEEAMIRIIKDNNLRKKLAEGAFSALKKLPSKEETMALYKQSWEKATKNK